MKSLFIFMLSCLLISCSTLDKSILTGAGGGTAVGFLIANQRRTSNATKAKETLVGTITGGVFAYLIHNLKKKKDKKKVPHTPPLKIPDKDLKSPFLTKPKVRTYWEPDKISGNKFVEGRAPYRG